MRREMKNPRGLDSGYECIQRHAIRQRDGVELHLPTDAFDAPRVKLRTEEQMDIVSVRQKSPGEIGSDESSRASDENPLQSPENASIVKHIQILPGARANFIAFTCGKFAGCGQVGFRRGLADGAPRINFLQPGAIPSWLTQGFRNVQAKLAAHGAERRMRV